MLLDITHLARQHQRSACRDREISIQFAGIDPIKAPIPVVPTCHYQMGGIPTNYKGQVVVPQGGTTTPGARLLCGGRMCACASVHGANRLGPTRCSICWCSANQPAKPWSRTSSPAICRSSPCPEDAADAFAGAARPSRRNQKNGESVHEVASGNAADHAEARWRFPLQHAAQGRRDKILAVAERAKNTQIADKSQVWNTARMEALELDNLIEVAKATMISAEARKESRGAHVRDDALDMPKRPMGVTTPTG